MKPVKPQVPQPPTEETFGSGDLQKLKPRDALKKRTSIEPTSIQQQLNLRLQPVTAQSQRTSPKQKNRSPTTTSLNKS